jgi:hypothetical protein
VLLNLATVLDREATAEEAQMSTYSYYAAMVA